MDSLPWIAVVLALSLLAVVAVGVWLARGQAPAAASADRMVAVGAPGLLDR